MNDLVKLSVSPTIVHRFGDELIKDQYTAFSELIKNSFDADATEVYVKISKTKKNDGKIIIQDNGSGMSYEDIVTKWARIANENKVREPYTPKFKRRHLGAKGIGRFSAAKLGEKIKIATRKNNSPDQLVFSLDFKDFTDDKNFNDMGIPIAKGEPKKGFFNGTIIEIDSLKHNWGKRDIEKVRNNLCHLIDPDNNQNFVIYIESLDWPELSGELKNPISGKETHKINFEITTNGQYKCEYVGPGSYPTPKNEKKEPPIFGTVSGTLKYYKEGIKSRDGKLSDEESHMGVKIYRDGCRVRPYGEIGDDWLEIKAKRARAGGKYYIQSQLLSGAIRISATDNIKLCDATNREAGIIDSNEFEQFKDFVSEHVDMLNRILEQETKSESQKQKRINIEKILDTVTDCLNDQVSDIYEKYVQKIDRNKKGQFGQTSKKKELLLSDIKQPDKTEWHCKDCGDNWRVLKQNIPHKCMEYAVNRKGDLRNVNGCGSNNIEAAQHQAKDLSSDLSSIISGKYALVAGRQVRIRVDREMGENEDEYIFDEREIVINGNHPAFVVAEKLDGMSEKKYEYGDDTYVPALSMHIAKCACLSWAEIHYKETSSWDDYKEKYEKLLLSICSSIRDALSERK